MAMVTHDVLAMRAFHMVLAAADVAASGLATVAAGTVLAAFRAVMAGSEALNSPTAVAATRSLRI
jgi:hypothetical protein